MGFPLTPRSTTFHDLELLQGQVKISLNFATFLVFRRQ